MANLMIIKDIAERRRISIRELAEKVGIKENQIHVMCRTNSTKIDTLEKISRALDVSVTTFFDVEGCHNETHGDNSPIGDGNMVNADPLLTERVKSLETLLAEKDERIAELKERIAELKARS